MSEEFRGMRQPLMVFQDETLGEARDRERLERLKAFALTHVKEDRVLFAIDTVLDEMAQVLAQLRIHRRKAVVRKREIQRLNKSLSYVLLREKSRLQELQDRRELDEQRIREREGFRNRLADSNQMRIQIEAQRDEFHEQLNESRARNRELVRDTQLLQATISEQQETIQGLLHRLETHA